MVTDPLNWLVWRKLRQCSLAILWLWWLGDDQVLLVVFLVDSISQLDSLNNEVFAATAKIFVLTLESLADLKEVQALLFPNRSDWGVIALKHLQLQLHLLHLLDDLLSLDLLLDQSIFVRIYVFGFTVLSQVDLVSEVVGDALQLLALLVLFAKNVDQFVSVNVLVDLKLLDLVFKFKKFLRLGMLVLLEALAVCLDRLHLCLELLDDFLGSWEWLLREKKLLLEDCFSLFRLSHLVPEIGVVRKLLLHQVDLVLVLLFH